MKIMLCGLAIISIIPAAAPAQGLVKPPQGIINDPRIKHKPPSNPDEQMNLFQTPSTIERAARRSQGSVRATMDALRRAERQRILAEQALKRAEQQRIEGESAARHAEKAARQSKKAAERALAESRKRIKPIPPNQTSPHKAP